MMAVISAKTIAAETLGVQVMDQDLHITDLDHPSMDQDHPSTDLDHRFTDPDLHIMDLDHLMDQDLINAYLFIFLWINY